MSQPSNKAADEKGQMDKPLRDLIEIIHFTENVSARIHGLLDEAEVYRTVMEEFARSKRYVASIMLLTDGGSALRITGSSLPSGKLKAGEKVTGLRLKEYKIDLNKSGIYREVVREGKTVQVNVSQIIGELFPQPLASLISKITGYERKSSILTPLKQGGEIIGALGISSTELAEYFIPSVKSLAQHISTELELAHETARSKRAEAALRLQSEITANMAEGVYLVRASDGVIVYANPRFEALFGYAHGELIGKHVSVVNAPTEKTPAETAQEINASLNENGEWRGEVYNIKKAGTPFWCYAIVSKFQHDEHGTIWIATQATTASLISQVSRPPRCSARELVQWSSRKRNHETPSIHPQFVVHPRAGRGAAAHRPGGIFVCQ